MDNTAAIIAATTASDLNAISEMYISSSSTTAVSDDESSITSDCRFHQSSQRLKVKLTSKKRSRQHKVRFETSSSKDTLIKKASCTKVKKTIKSSTSTCRRKNMKTSSLATTPTTTTTWYTPQEIKDSYKSIIIGAATASKKEGRSSSSSYFSIQKRQKRIRRKHQMYKILQAVQEYELATQTKVPDLLSQLLDRHSKSMVQEAVQIASDECSTSTDLLFA